MKNNLPPLFRVEYDIGFFQFFPIIVEAAHFDRALRQETMSVRIIAACNARDFKGNNLAVKGGDNLMQRPHPTKPAASPTHRIRPRQFFNRVRQDFRQEFGGVASFALDYRQIVGTFRIFNFFALIERHACRFQETIYGFLGRADTRAFFLFAYVRLFRG